MALYTISDLHLPLGIDKPMDIFGAGWSNYVEKIRENWQRIVSPDDTVVLGGDFSWATYLEQTEKDFDYLHSLNGKKILLKGNHDYWWSTLNKMNAFFKDKEYDSVSILQNNSFIYNDIGICGTRGWSMDPSSADDKKIYDRELIRLQLSMDDAMKKNCREIFVFLHYPPITQVAYETSFHKLMKEYPVKKCIFGHLHGQSHASAATGTIDGIEYILAASDYVRFNPVKLAD